MSGLGLGDNKVIGINDQLPIDMSKLAVWRKGLPQPTTFLVTEDVGRSVMTAFDSAVRSGTEGTVLRFDTYNDGGGRRSTTFMDCEDVVGLTLEFASIRLAGG